MKIPTNGIMLIGALADKAGVNTKTIRYYEDIGLMPVPVRTGGGYRTYGEGDLDRLRFIRQAQQLDLRLDEIGEILALRDSGEAPCSYVVEIATARLAELDAKIESMQSVRHELGRLLSDAADNVGKDAHYCPVIEHHNLID